MGMCSGSQDKLDHGRRGAARLEGPAHQAFRRPLQIRLMGLGHMLFERGMAAFEERTPVTGHPLALVETFHDVGRQSDLHLLLHELIGNAVIVAVDLHVVVDIHPGFFPLGVFVGLFRQWFERGPLHPLEQGPARAGQFLERPFVVLHQ